MLCVLVSNPKASLSTEEGKWDRSSKSPLFIQSSRAPVGSQLHLQLGLWEQIPWHFYNHTPHPRLPPSCTLKMCCQAHAGPKSILLTWDTEAPGGDTGVWTSRSLLLINNPVIHFANVLAPIWCPHRSNCSRNPPSHSPSRHTPHLPLRQDISWCKMQPSSCI